MLWRELSKTVDHRLTGQPGYSASLKRCREAYRHSVSFFKQSPKHHDGRGSCLALLGSDGIAGGSVAIPQSGDFPAQPASSRLSSSGATLGQFQFLSCTLALLIRQSLVALFFGSGLGGGSPLALRDLQPLIRPRGARRFGIARGGGRFFMSDLYPVLLATSNQHRAISRQHKAGTAHIRSVHFCREIASWSCRIAIKQNREYHIASKPN